jgi:hypothetical protein
MKEITLETGDKVQGVECLLCNHEALSSNPSPTKKRKRVNLIYFKNYYKD